MAKGQMRSNKEARKPKGFKAEDGSRSEGQLPHRHPQRPAMSGHDRPEPDDTELGRYGIKRVPADTFVWQGYRYTQARDALAAAKRAEKA